MLIVEEKKHKLTELKTGLDEADSLVCSVFIPASEIAQSFVNFYLAELLLGSVF